MRRERRKKDMRQKQGEGRETFQQAWLTQASDRSLELHPGSPMEVSGTQPSETPLLPNSISTGRKLKGGRVAAGSPLSTLIPKEPLNPATAHYTLPMGEPFHHQHSNISDGHI